MPPSPREVVAAATGRSFAPLASLPDGGGRRSDRKEFPQAANAFTCNTSHP